MRLNRHCLYIYKMFSKAFELSHHISPFATARKAIASLLLQTNERFIFVFAVALTDTLAKIPLKD